MQQSSSPLSEIETAELERLRRIEAAAVDMVYHSWNFHSSASYDDVEVLQELVREQVEDRMRADQPPGPAKLKALSATRTGSESAETVEEAVPAATAEEEAGEAPECTIPMEEESSSSLGLTTETEAPQTDDDGLQNQLALL